MTRTLHNSDLVDLAKKLRTYATKEENKLWYEFLRDLPAHFSRQKVIGKYIVDFYCASKKLVIEIDGSQHYEDKGVESDKQRDEYLASCGLTVLRYSNLEVNTKFKEVCEDIWNNLDIDN